MSVTYGFYNSKNGDRRYDAIQMSSIFDGIIRDGVFQHIGTAMMVEESEGMTVNVGIGRAWFNHTWTLNDAPLPLTVPLSEVILNRIDAIVLEVDARESVRENSIKIVKGVPASSPKNPTLLKTNDCWQYPLAYIRVDAGVTVIRQANITNCVGTSACPFITAPLEMMSIDALVAQWGDQWEIFFAQIQHDTADMQQQANKTFAEWFARMKDQLTEDAAGSLQTQIDALEEHKAETSHTHDGRYYTTSEVDALLKQSLLDTHPVGSLYFSSVATSPAILFGGTWVRITNAFIWALADGTASGSTGGSSTINLQHVHSTGNHTLLVDEIPSHMHMFYQEGRVLMWDVGQTPVGGTTSGSTVQTTWDAKTKTTGGGQPHNHGNTGNALSTTQSIMPPYVAYYCWRRTA